MIDQISTVGAVATPVTTAGVTTVAAVDLSMVGSAAYPSGSLHRKFAGKVETPAQRHALGAFSPAAALTPAARLRRAGATSVIEDRYREKSR